MSEIVNGTRAICKPHLLDWVATISEDPLVAVNEADLGDDCSSVHVTGVVHEKPHAIATCFNFAHIRAFDGPTFADRYLYKHRDKSSGRVDDDYIQPALYDSQSSDVGMPMLGHRRLNGTKKHTSYF